MIAETRAYFREMIDKDLDAGHLVRSNFAMLNEKLACALRNKRRQRPGDSAGSVAAGLPSRRIPHSGFDPEDHGERNHYISGAAWGVCDGTPARPAARTAPA